jgi:DNA repair protein RecO (recombination protein O)
MEWRDEGIILGTRKHGETSAILEVMTRQHGRHLGLVRGGRSRKLQPLLQPGNEVELSWRARLDEHLGMFVVEGRQLNAARLFESSAAVYGLQLLAAHLRLLPERDPDRRLYETLKLIIAHLDDPASAAELVIRFELSLLDDLGFGLDLSRCAASGAREGLAYVSPKTGRAVSREAGEPWHDKLLPLPGFLGANAGRPADQAALDQAFRLTGYFFARHVYEPRGLAEPEARMGFIAAVRRLAAGSAAQMGGDAA